MTLTEQGSSVPRAEKVALAAFEPNQFRVPSQAAKRLDVFLASPERTAPTHNINQYWQQRRDALRFQQQPDHVVVKSDSNLGGSLPRNSTPGKVWPLQLHTINLLHQAAWRLWDRLRRMEATIARRRYELEMRTLYHMLADRRDLFLPFGFWGPDRDPLQDSMLRRVIAVWPYRALLMLRAIDVIARYAPDRDHRPLRVLEIGSGPGILAGFMSHVLGSTHVLVDLPEQAAVGFSFLSEFFPAKQVTLPNERGGGRDVPDIAILTPEQLSRLDGRQFDVAVNMFSFQEMSYDAVSEYFRLIRASLTRGGIFYCANRRIKKNKFDGTIMEFDKYPWSGGDVIRHDVVHPARWRNVRMAGSAYQERVAVMRVKTSAGGLDEVE